MEEWGEPIGQQVRALAAQRTPPQVEALGALLTAVDDHCTKLRADEEEAVWRRVRAHFPGFARALNLVWHLEHDYGRPEQCGGDHP
jgi:hypothetical protein